jgi:hypothetical protein
MTNASISMGFSNKAFPPGTHACLIFQDEAERRKIISKYLQSGLRDGEKVAYFADAMSREEVAAWLADMGVDVPGDDRTDRFTVHDTMHVYCPGETFVPETVIETLKTFYRRAMADGFGNIRVSGEMAWALRGVPGSDRLMEYEARVNDAVVTHPVTAICQYDANRFDGGTIMDALKVHPMMIVKGQIVHNPYYMKPDDFIRELNGRAASANG